MKEIKLYCCEICGTNYNNKKMADTCEKNHKIPLKAKGCKWKPKSVENDGYPLEVLVEFADGSKVIYRKGGRIRG